MNLLNWRKGGVALRGDTRRNSVGEGVEALLPSSYVTRLSCEREVTTVFVAGGSPHCAGSLM